MKLKQLETLLNKRENIPFMDVLHKLKRRTGYFRFYK